jgi:hypothetical protein
MQCTVKSLIQEKFDHDLFQNLRIFTACSLGLSATSQQYFSLRTNQPPATSRNQPAVLFSQNKPAQAMSHQPTEQAVTTTWWRNPRRLLKKTPL